MISKCVYLDSPEKDNSFRSNRHHPRVVIHPNSGLDAVVVTAQSTHHCPTHRIVNLHISSVCRCEILPTFRELYVADLSISISIKLKLQFIEVWCPIFSRSHCALISPELAKYRPTKAIKSWFGLEKQPRDILQTDGRTNKSARLRTLSRAPAFCQQDSTPALFEFFSGHLSIKR